MTYDVTLHQILSRIVSYCACRFSFLLHHRINRYQSQATYFPIMARKGAREGRHATIGNVYEHDEAAHDEQLIVYVCSE